MNDIQRIDAMIEPAVKAEIALMEKNFACHGSIYDCSGCLASPTKGN